MMRRWQIGGASLIAAAGAWWTFHTPNASLHQQHAKMAIDAAIRLHHSVIGTFHPPQPGEATDVAALEMESAGDKVYTLTVAYLVDELQDYDRHGPGDTKTAIRNAIQDHVKELRLELLKFASTDVMIVQPRDDLRAVLDLIEKDAP